MKGSKNMQESNRQQELGRLLLQKSPDELESLIHQSAVLMTYYRCAVLEIETKFKVLDAQFSLSHERNPIESIHTRIKSPESIREKLDRKHLPMTVEAIEDNINDIGGVRVICSFLDDIYMLSDCLLQQDDVRLIAKKDYIKNPKPNGYRSLHLIVEIPIFLYNEKRMVRVEVQLRTIAMQSWANLEHRLRYKKNLSPEVLAQTEDTLLACAVMSNQLDEQMQSIRRIIEDDSQ
ncbi:MAG: GTP pyrophosphokinase family protein [Clostridia bacterium]|nr:GTP pyrophosphokinase family protein [Clostridia bacterium]